MQMDLNVNDFRWKLDLRLFLVLFLYIVIGIFLINYYQFILNSDGISYINIAQKYLIGDFENSINGYWGPLFSWLMIPFLFFSSTPLSNLYLVKILSLITGFFTIIGIKSLSEKFEIDGWIQTMFLFSLIPIMLTFSLFMITPDLMVLCLLIFYLNYIIDSNYSKNVINGVLCGLFGSLAFLTKSYAFLFFISHFTVSNLFYYYQSVSQQNKKIILKNFFIGLSVFFIISGAWIGIISDKYGYITMGTTGKYNYELVGPESQGHAMFYQGLIKPPNSAVSAWEDPSYFHMKSWSAYGSWNNFEHQIKLILDNILKIFSIMEIYSIFSLIIILGAIVFILKVPEKTTRSKVIYLLLTIVIFSGGYSFILVESRYLWLVYILLMITAIYLVNNLYKLNRLSEIRRNVILILIIISFIAGPVQALAINLNLEKDVYDLSNSLHDYNVQGNIASDGNWELTIYLVYYLKSKYYGVTLNNNDNKDVSNQLKENKIDYYLVWDNAGDFQLEGYEEITYGRIKGLRIYSRIGSQ